MKRLLVLIFIFLTPFISYSFEYEIKGNTKTSKSVISDEFKDLVDKTLTEDIVQEIKRRIWNLRIFSDVSVYLLSNNRIKIDVKERWTTIPIAKFSGGGGSTYYAVGAYDINSFGRNTELGLQYESLNNRPAGVIWWRKPQFLTNRNLTVGLDIWSINRVRFLFKRNGEDKGAFTLKRNRLNSFIEYRLFNDFLVFGLSIDAQDDQVSDFGLSKKLIQLNSVNNISTELDNENVFYKFKASIGRLNYENYLIRGTQLRIDHSIVQTNEEKLLSQTEVGFNYYKLFNNHHNFAWNFKYISTNLEQVQNLSYLGGLGEVRGYLDGQFFGNATWQNNIEHRFDIYSNSYGVIQAALFSDQGKEGDDIDLLTRSKDEILLSSGLGVRFISPKIFRFVARLDYAQTHTRFISQNISFGIQQFF